jgi:ribonuclease BN (tRNA processing enzyme)
VKVTLLPSTLTTSATAGGRSCQHLTSYIVNGNVGFDAGSLGFYQGPAEQAAVRRLFLTHSHMDHIASLPVFLENVAGLTDAPVDLYASEAVQQSLRLDVFNGRLWPDFLKLTHKNNMPFVTLHTIAGGQPLEVEGLRITPVPLHHVVPTLGFIVEEPSSAVVIVSDTGPTEEIWERARGVANLKAVFLEATFPDAMKKTADISMHLTPATFLREVQKLPLPVKFFAVHMKAQFREQVAQELLAHRLANLEIVEFGRTYEF